MIKLKKYFTGGQRQRVALARTLLEDRPVIWLMNPSHLTRVPDDMQDLQLTILLAGCNAGTHDPGEATRLCNHIYLLQDNKPMENPLPGPFPKPVDDRHALDLQVPRLL